MFAEIGAHTAAGMAEGVEGGTADVQGSLAALVNPAPAAALAPAAPAEGGGKASGIGGGNTFNFYGVKDAKDAVDQFLAFLEGGVDQLGAGEPA